MVWGQEATGEEATINIWKRSTGEHLHKISGSAVQGNGHSNMINQVNSTPALPYLLISCSDDESIKIWGVPSKAKVEVVNQTGKAGKESIKRINVKLEEQKGEVGSATRA